MTGIMISGALLLTLAGCFRPAGEEAPRTAEGAPLSSSASGSVDMPVTSALPALTMVSGDGVSVIDVPAIASPAATGDGSVVMSTLVLEPGSALPTADSASASGISITIIAPGTAFATPTLPASPLVDTSVLSGGQTPPGTLVTVEFITPFSPLSPITPEPTSDQPASATPSGLITPTSLPGTGGGDCLYAVQPGDSLYAIALDNEITLQSLRDANPDLTGDAPVLQIGQQITLPCGTATPASPAVETDAPADSAPLDTTTVPNTVAGEEYTVRRGDTLFTIATRNGITVQALIDANNLTNPDRLDIGQVLIIPSG